jgi:hypothetical protein
MKTILYILGEAHSGKSEAAKHLRKAGFTEIALADPMKRALMDWYGFTEEQLWGPSELRNAPDERLCRGEDSISGHELSELDPEDYLSPREGLQTLGEAMRRAYSKTWLRILFRDIAKLETEFGLGSVCWYDRTKGVQYGELNRLVFDALKLRVRPKQFLVPDVRHRNEHLALRKVGAKGFRLVSLTQGAGLTGKLAEHRSEVEQRTIPDSELDAVIVNDGTLEELYAKIDAFLEEHVSSS